MRCDSKSTWQKDSLFKLTYDNKLFGLAITTSHPIFSDVLKLFNEYQTSIGMRECQETIATHDDIEKVRNKQLTWDTVVHDIDINEVLRLLKMERECVRRNENHECNRDCASCDLCQNTEDLLKMYDDAIRMIGEGL